MQDKQELFPKTVEVTFTYRGVNYKHKCQLPLTNENKLLMGEPMKVLKHSVINALRKANYLYKEDLKTKEENIYYLITQIEVFVIVERCLFLGA